MRWCWWRRSRSPTGTPTPSLGLIMQGGGWIALANVVVTALAVGVGSLTGSRALTLTAVIGWQAIVTNILVNVVLAGLAAQCIAHPRADADHAAQQGSGDHPVIMATGVAVVVILRVARPSPAGWAAGEPGPGTPDPQSGHRACPTNAIAPRGLSPRRGRAATPRRSASGSSRWRSRPARTRPAAARPSKLTALLWRERPRRRVGSVRDGPSTSTSSVRPTKRCARSRARRWTTSTSRSIRSTLTSCGTWSGSVAASVSRRGEKTNVKAPS